MNYYGNYEERLSFLHNWILTHADTNFNPRHNIVSSYCSIFTFVDDTSGIFLGRNFDWGDGCGILLAKYNPPGKYCSFAFSRTEDLKFSRYSEPKKFTPEEKVHFLFFPFYAVDGINEKGLAVGVAGVNSQKLKLSSDKELIFITLFVRYILDNCKNVDEVIQLSKNYNLYDGTLSTISHHLLVADADGASLIIEYKNG
jgi:penicillin V acylase-like amidase (Ntn superfamily)